MSSLARHHRLPHHAPATSRRDWLARAGSGFGALALAALEHEAALAATSAPLAPKSPHAAARATSVIFLFMEGGPSHLDTFDPKPLLRRLAGQPLPESFGRVITPMGEGESPLLAAAARGSATGSPTPPASSTISPSFGRASPTGSTTPAASAR